MINEERLAEIAANLAAVRKRIAAACAAVQRRPDEITLVAITKTYPASDVVHLATLGVREVGENRDQEAAGKAAEVRAAGADVHWHFVGQLQRNKARSVASYADLVHSVDRPALATALAEAAAKVRDRPLDVLIQVNLDPDAPEVSDPQHRGGVSPGSVAALAELIGEDEALRLRGVMAVAPVNDDAGAAFARLAVVARELRADHPNATVVSAGMSGDLEEAIAHGATHVRVGTALLGKRALLG
ncbi:MAG: YggS family pyridoxal phosphate-dependent enzyme [Hamadaea sp.]|uniref:YggS family pyridoxal phosphate-dependent enzyme n=1 Tax=Hamadaea sp. TaxID=2024425 RepID=UPI001841C6A7|nr:YggS family pyridoxal phosphate-dependent enzyme [Hamadaea sp.]NUR70979.1 YggS family pyridoxal phosphate-dependent enzyme [Hamadaea sp.]NUT21655.1 YggS family pyridoxal phosphate-dependent enzyme [Hamadaea sp.]